MSYCERCGGMFTDHTTAGHDVLAGLPTTPELEKLREIGDYERAQEIEAMRAENIRLKETIARARTILAPMAHNPIPSLMQIRAALDILR